jgi:hypothetical protein
MHKSVDESLREMERELSRARSERLNKNIRVKLSAFIRELPHDAPIPLRLKLREALDLLEV